METKELPEIEDIVIEAVSSVYHCTIEEINSPSRKSMLVAPRQIIMYLLHRKVEMSYPDVGRKLGNRDHTTIIHGVRRVERRIAVDSDYRDCVEAFILMLGLEKPRNKSAIVHMENC